MKPSSPAAGAAVAYTASSAPQDPRPISPRRASSAGLSTGVGHPSSGSSTPASHAPPTKCPDSPQLGDFVFATEDEAHEYFEVIAQSFSLEDGLSSPTRLSRSPSSSSSGSSSSSAPSSVDLDLMLCPRRIQRLLQEEIVRQLAKKDHVHTASITLTGASFHALPHLSFPSEGR